jgi:hypothetical protein
MLNRASHAEQRASRRCLESKSLKFIRKKIVPNKFLRLAHFFSLGLLFQRPLNRSYFTIVSFPVTLTAFGLILKEKYRLPSAWCHLKRGRPNNDIVYSSVTVSTHCDCELYRCCGCYTNWDDAYKVSKDTTFTNRKSGWNNWAHAREYPNVFCLFHVDALCKANRLHGMSVGHTVYECVILREEYTLGVGE